jgi:serine/threonine-protein kinase
MQLGVDEALEITKSVAAALQYAHERQVVHRDIKPENILLQSGQALVADFGIALAVSQAGGTRLTQTGLSLGTPAYMSPEQATGDRVLDARSDIYSLGCMTYEMLVGEPPHVGNSVQAIIAKILSERPAPVSQTRDLVPPNVDAAVQKALAKSPADRFRSAAEFSAALTNAQFTLPTAAASATAVTAVARSRRDRKAAAAIPLAAVSGLLLVAALWGWLRPGPPAPQVARLPILLPDSAPLQQQSGILFALSDDGSSMVYTGPGDNDIDLWLRPLSSLSATRIPGTAGADSPFLSPAGDVVAFYRNNPNAVFTVSLRGGPRLTVATDSMRALGGDWGPDGSIYFVRTGGIRRLLPEGGAIEEVTRVDTARGDVRHAWVDVLPSGQAAIFTIERTQEAQYDIAVADLRSKAVKILFRGVYAKYAPTGHIVYAMSDGGLFAIAFDEKSLATRGNAIPIAAGVVLAEGVSHFAISASGSLLYGTGGVGGTEQIEWVDRRGQVQRQDTTAQGAFDNVALSPDGRTLAFGLRDASGYQIWTKDLEGGTTGKLTVDGTQNFGASWLPGGRSVMYTSQSGGPAKLLQRRADGSAPAETVLEASRPIAYGFVTPDGEWVIYQTEIDGPTRRDLFARRLRGDTTTMVIAASPADEMAPRLSPDGHWLAYVSDESGPPTVYVSPFPNTTASRVQVSVGGGAEPFWSRNGRELFYTAFGTPWDLMVARVETSPTFRVLDRTLHFSRAAYNRSIPDAPFYDVSPDGQRFLMTRRRGQASEQLVLVLNWFEELKAATPR